MTIIDDGTVTLYSTLYYINPPPIFGHCSHVANETHVERSGLIYTFYVAFIYLYCVICRRRNDGVFGESLEMIQFNGEVFATSVLPVYLKNHDTTYDARKQTNIRLCLYNWHALPVSKEYLGVQKQVVVDSFLISVYALSMLLKSQYTLYKRRPLARVMSFFG